MAKIVCIDTGTLRPNCAVDDIVGTHESSDTLTGLGYANYKIYEVKNVTRAELDAKLISLLPEREPAFRLSEGGKWLHEQPEEIRTWKNADGKWCELVEDPKYKISLALLTEQDKADLADEKVIGIQTLVILDKCSEKIHLNEKNNMEVEGLNK